jgi:hypothetical protein
MAPVGRQAWFAIYSEYFCRFGALIDSQSVIRGNYMPKSVSKSEAEEPEKQDELRAFLVKLATDPTELGNFIKHPEDTMDRAGLSADDKALLRTGNAAAINARLAGRAVHKGAAPPVLVVDVNEKGEPRVREDYLPGPPPAFFHETVWRAPLPQPCPPQGVVPTETIWRASLPHPYPPYGAVPTETVWAPEMHHPYFYRQSQQWRPPPCYPGWQ